MQDPLRGIKATAEAMTSLTAPLVAPHQIVASFEIPPLLLVAPPDLRPRFQDLELKDDAILELNRAFDKAAAAIKQHSVIKFEEICRQLLTTVGPSGCSPLSDLFERLRHTFQETYERNLRFWSNERIPALIACLQIPSSCTSKAPAACYTSTRKNPFRHVSLDDR